MAAADRGSARHWLAARHVTGAGRAGGRGAGGGGAGAAAARRRLAGGAAEPLAARFSGREREGDGEGEKEVRAARLPGGRRRPTRGCRGLPCAATAPRPLGGHRSFGDATVRPGNAGGDCSARFGSPRVCPRPTQAGWRGGGSLWARQPVPVLGGVSRGGRTYVDRVLQMRKLKHKEMKPLAEVARWGEEKAEFEPLHREASLALALGFISLAQRYLW